MMVEKEKREVFAFVVVVADGEDYRKEKFETVVDAEEMDCSFDEKIEPVLDEASRRFHSLEKSRFCR